MSPTVLSYVDLAQAPYNVVANDPSALDTNTSAIRQALADHPNSTMFVLPMGDIHIHRNLAFGGVYRTAAIQINGVQHNHHDLVISGWGPDVTRLLIDGDQGNTTSQGIQIADGAQRITLTGFTISCASTVSNVSAGLTTHSIELNAINEDVVDTLIYNVNFGPGCGDGIRNAGGTSTFLRNTRVLNVTMRMFGCPAAPKGSRSGISFQKGILDYEFGSFYVRGQKNSPFDCEPSAASVMSGFNIHDGTFDNADGSTMVAVSFDGFHFTDPVTHVITAYPLRNSRFVNVVVLNGQAQIIATKNCVWRDVTIYANGTGGMAIDTLNNQGPLLFMEGFNEDLILDNVSITRDTGCPVGDLIAEFQLTGAVNSVTMTRARFVGGIWTTTVAPNANDGAYVRIQDADDAEFRGCMLRVLDPAPTTRYGFLIRPFSRANTNFVFDGVRVDSPNGKLISVIYAAAINQNISNFSVRGMKASQASVTPLKFDASGGGAFDPNPIVCDNDFSGMTTLWGGSAAAAVFPVIGGNRGAIAQYTGTVPPGGPVAAVAGSLYFQTNGNIYVSTGGTAWKQLTVA